jgi:hypothetical protein
LSNQLQLFSLIFFLPCGYISLVFLKNIDAYPEPPTRKADWISGRARRNRFKSLKRRRSSGSPIRITCHVPDAVVDLKPRMKMGCSKTDFRNIDLPAKGAVPVFPPDQFTITGHPRKSHGVFAALPDLFTACFKINDPLGIAEQPCRQPVSVIKFLKKNPLQADIRIKSDNCHVGIESLSDDGLKLMLRLGGVRLK